VFRIERLLGVDELGHVMDSPGQWPQWQFHEGQRAALLESQGFRVDREIHRFEFHTGEAKLPSVDERGLIFRSLIEVGEGLTWIVERSFAWLGRNRLFEQGLRVQRADR
jgi:hypothetical protein